MLEMWDIRSIASGQTFQASHIPTIERCGSFSVQGLLAEVRDQTNAAGLIQVVHIYRL